MGTDSMGSPPWPDRGLTRKQLLRHAAAGGFVLSTSGLLAACSDDDDSEKSNAGSSASAEGTPKRGGTLRVGIPQGSEADTFDPHMLFVYPDWARAFNLYNLLAYPNPETFELEFQLAEEIESNDKGDVWTVRLKDGVEFHDGKTLAAEDLIFSIRRMINSGGPAASSLFFVDTKRLKQVDKRTVELTFKTPYAEFPQAMAASNEFIVPVGFDKKKPVGTGPFKFKSIKPGDNTVMSRFENYWGDGPYVDEVVIVNLNEESARVNALLAGQIDAMQSLPLQQLSTVQSKSDLAVLNAETGNWSPFTLRMDVKPFSDVKVRQAMRLIADRDQLLEQALLGQGRVANDLYSPYDPAYNDELPQRKQDIDQAKSLLKQAGYADLNVELVTAPINVGVVEASQIFAEQAKAAGVSVKLQTKDAGTFYTDGWLTYPFAADTNPTYPSYLATVALQDGPGAPFNAPHFKDADFTRLYHEASATLDEAKRGDLQREMQKIQYERGGYLIYAFYNQVDALKSSVKGFVPDKSGWPLTSYNFSRVWFDK
jgi:peptide/nickel transport system substrate-binding protein